MAHHITVQLGNLEPELRETHLERDTAHDRAWLLARSLCDSPLTIIKHQTAEMLELGVIDDPELIYYGVSSAHIPFTWTVRAEICRDRQCEHPHCEWKRNDQKETRWSPAPTSPTTDRPDSGPRSAASSTT